MKTLLRLTVVFCAVAGMLAAPRADAAAPSPLETIKKPVSDIISILNDPQYKNKPETQQELIWERIHNFFDFTAVAQRALARNWLKFDDEQRKAFTQVFSQFLGNLYIDQIQSKYDDDKVEFVQEEIIDEDRAIVETRILRNSTAIPVDYSLRLSDGAWKVYDVKVEGVSLIKNYRVQFRDILRTKTPEYLIDILQKKLKD